MKYEYSLIINKIPEESDEYIYKYSKTSDIVFRISKQSCSVTAMRSTKKDIAEFIPHEDNLFSDAVKKAMLIHIVKFSENLNIESITMKINGKEKIFNYDKDNPLIYSLVNGKLFREIPESWDNPVFIKALLNTPKSNYDSRMASLFSYINSKSKMYEIERFNYMWISFNGMYNYFWEKVKSHVNGEINGKNSEVNQMSALMRAHDMADDFADGKSAWLIEHDARAIIKKLWDGAPVTRESLENGCHKELAGKIKNILYKRTDVNGKVVVFDKGRQKKYYNSHKKGNLIITPYSYLLVLLPYRIRCNTLHANKVIKLFSYFEESDIIIYRFVSDMLEKFIEENLIKWFDNDYAEGTLETMAEKASAGVNLKQKEEKKKSD